MDESAGDDRVFKALADPARRALLDALFVADGQSVQALCERHPEMTRFGVMKHLAVWRTHTSSSSAGRAV
ncbi:MAG: helix-turn-helix domain-containing protein [Ilumatobacteraceae bacterium]